MLTCDAFGVLPPIARLTPAQAMYHFLSGFTSKVAGTERGVTEPQPTFSTCFGAPFMPRRPEVYGALLRDRIAAAGAACWLVNTGWTGGAYGTGRRMPIAATRALLTAALDGSLERRARSAATRTSASRCRSTCRASTPALLDPRSTWADPAAYDAQAAKLAAMFAENFAQYEDHVSDAVQRRRRQAPDRRAASADRDDPVPPCRLRARRGRRRPATSLATAPAPARSGASASSPPLIDHRHAALPPPIATGGRATASRSRSAIACRLRRR